MAVKNVPKVLVKAYLNRYPIRVRWQQFNVLKRWMWLRPVLEELQAELFPPEPEPEVEEGFIPASISLPPAAGVQQIDSPYRQYACVQGDPLRCNRACSQTTTSNSSTNFSTNCSTCGFPALLPEKAKLVGQRGSYQVERWLNRRGMGRLYEGIQIGTNQPVVIKEYLLPSRYFNSEEVRLRKTAFKEFASMSLADGKSQDFRFLMPLEAIADGHLDRCYLIFSERYACSSLNQYLAIRTFSEAQVRSALNQVLQSLEFLHTQKFRLSTGQVQTGFFHSNLSLDSLLLRTEQDMLDSDFLIDVCDLGIWEHLFDPPALKRNPGSIAEDLQALGYISFYLLAGKVIGSGGQLLDPLIQTHWVPVDPAFKAWMMRLLGVEAPFESAAIARQELLRLPRPTAIIPPEPLVEQEIEPRRQIPRWLIVLLSVVGVSVLGWLLLPKVKVSNAARPIPSLCCIKDIAGIPEGKFTYTSAQDGVWRYVLQQPNLIQKGQTLEQRLHLAQPKLNLHYQPSESTEAAIAQVQSGQAAFAIVPLIQPIPEDLQAQTIAYDGLALFVAFSYSERDQGLPKHLNGELSLDQIRQIYQGEVNNWEELGDSQLPIKAYQPTNQDAISVFEQRVLKQSKLQSAQNLAQTVARSVSETEMMRAVLGDFESQRIGSIGFGSISKIVGQCSIYPLALKTEQQAVQPIVLQSGTPINTTTDLCSKKGNYFADVDAFRTGRYPLSFAIAVVYPRSNDRPPVGEKFAALLATREGQRLLAQAGLVPLERSGED